NRDAASAKASAPQVQLIALNTEGRVTGPARAMQGNGDAINNDLLASGVFGIENEQDALPNAEHELTVRNAKDFGEAEDRRIKMLGGGEVFHIKSRFKYGVERAAFNRGELSLRHGQCLS